MKTIHIIVLCICMIITWWIINPSKIYIERNSKENIIKVLELYDFVKNCEKEWWIITFEKQEQFVIFTKILFDERFTRAFTEWWFYHHLIVKPQEWMVCEMYRWHYPMWWDLPNIDYNLKEFESKYWFTIR